MRWSYRIMIIVNSVRLSHQHDFIVLGLAGLGAVAEIEIEIILRYCKSGKGGSVASS